MIWLVCLLIIVGIATSMLLGPLIASAAIVIVALAFDGNYSVFGNGIWNVFYSFTFTAVPVFILMGELLNHTGLAKRIFTAVTPLFERLPGGLIQTTIGGSAVFSAISGSSTATTFMVGGLTYDELGKRGYDRMLALGATAAGGTLGILIPPSIGLIIYGAWQSVSISTLFLAGVVPGLMLVLMFMTYIAIVSRSRGPDTMQSEHEVIPLREAVRKSLTAWPFLILMAAVLGTVFAGLATPTEAGALGVVTVLVLAALFRCLKFSDVWAALQSTVRTFSMLSLVLLGAITLSQAVALIGLPQEILGAVTEAGLPPQVMIILIFAIYLVLGCFFGPLEMLLMTLPFTYPLVTGLGFNPVWFGIALVIVIEIGLLTPPLGINLFVVMAVSRGEVSLMEAARACLPFWLIMMAGLVIVTLLPGLVLWLPGVMGQ